MRIKTLVQLANQLKHGLTDLSITERHLVQHHAMESKSRYGELKRALVYVQRAIGEMAHKPEGGKAP